MEFITLSEAVANIAKCVKLTPHSQDTLDFIHPISQEAAVVFWETVNPKIEWARRFGIAAMQLNKALHDKPIQWMKYDEEKRFAVRSNIIHEEGVELLTHATLWGSREQDNCCNHFREAITQGGDNALKKAIVRSPDDGLAPDGKMIRWLKIGFDRAELLNLLEEQEIENAIYQPLDAVQAFIQQDYDGKKVPAPLFGEGQSLPVPQDENSGAADDGGEYTLDGKPSIANHLGMSVSWVRQQLKKGLPHRKKGNRHVTACPAEIEEWFKRLPKKKPVFSIKK